MLAQTIDLGQTEQWILVYTLTGDITPGETFSASIADQTKVTVSSPATVAAMISPLRPRDNLLRERAQLFSLRNRRRHTLMHEQAHSHVPQKRAAMSRCPSQLPRSPILNHINRPILAVCPHRGQTPLS